MQKKCDIILFDVDSTLVTIEGIDWLGQEKNIDVTHLTHRAMAGHPFEDIYIERLRLINPSQDEIAALGEMYVKSVVKGAKEIIQKLSEKWSIYLVSGGFYQAILPLAKYLSIDEKRVYAVPLLFKDGNLLWSKDKPLMDMDMIHRRFNPSLLTTSDGKKKIISKIKEDHSHSRILFIGDGATDLQGKHLVDVFAAASYVVRRPSVVEEADVELTAIEQILELVHL